MQSITGIGVKSLADLRIATPLITFLFILKFKHFFLLFWVLTHFNFAWKAQLPSSQMARPGQDDGVLVCSGVHFLHDWWGMGSTLEKNGNQFVSISAWCKQVLFVFIKYERTIESRSCSLP
jgi:hypothetical protein